MNKNRVYLEKSNKSYKIDGLPILFLIILVLSACRVNTSKSLKNSHPPSDQIADDKHKGGHLFGHIEEYCLDSLAEKNFDWITIVPFGSQKDFDSPEVIYFRRDSAHMRLRDSMLRSKIDIAHQAGFKVFLKPHIWLDNPSPGVWRSDIFPANDNHWQTWRASYRDFILHYAHIAQTTRADLFCIGAEFTKLTRSKPDFWLSLIRDVRKVYSGKLTYAANWYKEFEDVPFWQELDYIGIQAYFPLVDKDNPSVEQLSKGWNQYLADLEALHDKHNLKILFTEMGYKSTSDSGIQPWRWLEYKETPVSPLSYTTQANCYQAFFETVWKNDWFGGVHLWQLRCDTRGNGDFGKLDFTPLGKPAEAIITQGFQ